MMADLDIFVPCITPPLPVRNANHRLPRLPPITFPNDTVQPELIPEPLFSHRKRAPSQKLFVTIRNIPDLSRPLPPKIPSSPTTSYRSSSASIASTPPTSVPSSPESRPRALSSPFKAPNPTPWEPEWPLSSMPRQTLRRKSSPKKESLRSLRAKESDACLQKVYDKRLEAYLNGDIFQRGKWEDTLGSLVE